MGIDVEGIGGSKFGWWRNFDWDDRGILEGLEGNKEGVNSFNDDCCERWGDKLFGGEGWEGRTPANKGLKIKLRIIHV